MDKLKQKQGPKSKTIQHIKESPTIQVFDLNSIAISHGLVHLYKVFERLPTG